MYTFKVIYHFSQFPDLQEDGSTYLGAFFHKRPEFCQCHYKVPVHEIVCSVNIYSHFFLNFTFTDQGLS